MESDDKCYSFLQNRRIETFLTSHAVDIGIEKPIKQEHFAVSPAIEKLLFAEVDRMLAATVIS